MAVGALVGVLVVLLVLASQGNPSWSRNTVGDRRDLLVPTLLRPKLQSSAIPDIVVEILSQLCVPLKHPVELLLLLLLPPGCGCAPHAVAAHS